MGYFATPQGDGGGGGGGDPSNALEQLWAWNGADVTQFDTGNIASCTNEAGVGPAGSVALSVVAGFQGTNALQLSITNLQGGLVVPVLAAELALPARFVMEARITVIDANLIAMICPFFNLDNTVDIAPGFRGLCYRRQEAAATATLQLTTFNAPQNDQVMRSSGITAQNPQPGDTWNQTAEDRGGEEIALECWRQAGANPNDWAVRAVLQSSSVVDAGALARQNVASFADTSPDWDGEDLDRFGIGVYADPGPPGGGVVQISDLRIFQHPFDRPRS